MASTYYVSTIGNDSTGDGSVGNPYATPGKAMAVAVAAGDTGAQFVERCSMLALRRYWSLSDAANDKMQELAELLSRPNCGSNELPLVAVA